MEKLRSYFAKSQHLRLSETQSKVKQAKQFHPETANLDLKNHSKIHIIDAPVVGFFPNNQRGKIFSSAFFNRVGLY
jgi:hypothetical protein